MSGDWGKERRFFSFKGLADREQIIGDAPYAALRYHSPNLYSPNRLHCKTPRRTTHQSGISGATEVISVDYNLMVRMVCSQMYWFPDVRSGSHGVASVCAKFGLFRSLVLTEHRAMCSHVNEGAPIDLSVCGINGRAQSWPGCGKQDWGVQYFGGATCPPLAMVSCTLFLGCVQGDWGRELCHVLFLGQRFTSVLGLRAWSM